MLAGARNNPQDSALHNIGFGDVSVHSFSILVRRFAPAISNLFRGDFGQWVSDAIPASGARTSGPGSSTSRFGEPPDLTFGKAPSAVMEVGPFGISAEGISWPPYPGKDCIWLAKFKSRSHMLAFLQIWTLQHSVREVHVTPETHEFVLNDFFCSSGGDSKIFPMSNDDDGNPHVVWYHFQAYFAELLLIRLYWFLLGIYGGSVSKEVPEGLGWLISSMPDYLAVRESDDSAYWLFKNHPMISATAKYHKENQYGSEGIPMVSAQRSNYPVFGASSLLTEEEVEDIYRPEPGAPSLNSRWKPSAQQPIPSLTKHVDKVLDPQSPTVLGSSLVKVNFDIGSAFTTERDDATAMATDPNILVNRQQHKHAVDLFSTVDLMTVCLHKWMKMELNRRVVVTACPITQIKIGKVLDPLKKYFQPSRTRTGILTKAAIDKIERSIKSYIVFMQLADRDYQHFAAKSNKKYGYRRPNIGTYSPDSLSEAMDKPDHRQQINMLVPKLFAKALKLIETKGRKKIVDPVEAEVLDHLFAYVVVFAYYSLMEHSFTVGPKAATKESTKLFDEDNASVRKVFFYITNNLMQDIYELRKPLKCPFPMEQKYRSQIQRILRLV